jgi:hypothetical protein
LGEPGNETADTALRGWGERTRTRKCRFEKMSLEHRANPLAFRNILGPEIFRGEAAKNLTCGERKLVSPVCRPNQQVHRGERLGASFEQIVHANPEAFEQSLGKAESDIAIGPRVLAPADKADATPDVCLIDLLYLAHAPVKIISRQL